MRYNKNMMNDVIDELLFIREYDYITYPNEDEVKADEILKKIEKLVVEWKEMHDSNYSY